MMSLVRPTLDRHPRPRKKKRKRFLLKENPESRSVRHRRCKNRWERERGAILSPQKLRNQIDPIPKQRSKNKGEEDEEQCLASVQLCDSGTWWAEFAWRCRKDLTSLLLLLFQQQQR